MLIRSGAGFTPPSSADFDFKPIFGSTIFTTKPVFLCFLSVILIATFFILSARKAAIVPSRLQFAGESIYGFVRETLGHEVIGHEFMRFVPVLFSPITSLELFRSCNSQPCRALVFLFQSHSAHMFAITG